MNVSDNFMKCDEYREAIAADPSESFAGGAEHTAACEACSVYRAEMRALDVTIAKALAIDVPDLKVPDLPPIGDEDGNVVNMPFSRPAKISTPAWIGIAASFALVAIIGVQFIDNESTNDRLLAETVLAHVDHEPWSLKVTDVSVSDNRFASVVNPSIGTMDHNVGLVSYAQSCIINGNTIPHLVIQGEKGPVTLLLMPDEMVDGAVTLSGENVNGVILPHGNGSIAIIGEREERIEDLKRRVVESVEWSI